MIIFVNPKARGGRLLESWNFIDQRLRRISQHVTIHTLNGKAESLEAISRALREHEHDFVAAGGDGTLNSLLNLLLEQATPYERSDLRLGAIGLGSSNDFHKPINGDQLIDGISWKTDFQSAQWRDVGRLRFDDHGVPSSRYFLVNASVGVTAEANLRFNNPGILLRLLKNLHTPSAILYAAVSTILDFESFDVNCVCATAGTFTVSLSNLGIVKNPHFSGNLSYGDRADYDDGKFTLKLAHGMNTGNLFRLLRKLGKGHPGADVTSWQSDSLSVSAQRPFAVEFDGEVITTTKAEFSVLPKYIKVCQ